MKSAFPLLLLPLAVVAGGVAGAGVALLLGSRSAGPEGSLVAPAGTANAELAARVEALVAENRALRERLEVLELRPAVEARAPVVSLDGLVPQEEFDAFKDSVEQALAGLGGASPPAGGLKEQVAEALGTIRKEERVQSVKASQERRVAGLDETMPKLEERLGLSPYQSGRLRSALLAQYEREAELIRLWEQSVDDELLGQRKTDDLRTFSDELAGFLSEEQLDAFRNVMRASK